MIPTREQLRPPIVLVADRTLSARYKVLFEGMFATMQTTQTPRWAMRRLLAPAMPADRAGRAWAVPIGLRRVEAALLAQTPLGPDDVVCATPESLGRLLGPWTRIVAVSSSDPLGRGMSNTTTASFCGGQLYTKVWTARMMAEIARAKRRCGFTVVAGGAGAWQWATCGNTARQQGIDLIFEGCFEAAGPALFMDIIEGRCVPEHFREPATCADKIQPIRGASLLGIVELSRGCGRGCRFCASKDRPMAHLPADTILADLETNAGAGIRSAVSGSEDFFRYGSAGPKVNFEALRGLLAQMRRISGLSFMQIDHANVSSVLQFSDDQLREIRRLLTWSAGSEYLWVNMGLESASGRLVAANAPGKTAPFAAEDWDRMVREACAKMMRTGFFPVFSVILGLPGESGADVAATLRLVRHLDGQGAVVFPIFYEPPPGSGDQAFDVSRMREDHLELFTTCYEMNFRRVPRLLWDNQRAGGVSWCKRMLFQILGRCEVRLWRKRFAALAGELASRRHAPPREAAATLAAEKRRAVAGSAPAAGGT